MSFSSILSSTAIDPPKPAVSRAPAHKQPRRESKTPNGDASTTIALTSSHNSVRKAPRKSPALIKEEPVAADHVRDHPKARVSKSNLPPKVARTTSTKDVKEALQALADVAEMGPSDVEFAAWADAKEGFRQVSCKRQLSVGIGEASKNKVCV